MKIIFLLFFSILGYVAKCQTSYTGFIGKYPIQLVTYIYSDGVARAIYAYDNYDTPIVINGKKVGNNLELYERNEKNEILATFTFTNFDKTKKSITGIWASKIPTKTFIITLNKTFDIEEDSNWPQRELLQATSTKDHYFKLLLSKGEYDARVTGIKVFQKKTDKLIQEIELDCQLWGLENTTTGDFNFDGLEDFSVFESSYAGPNTSSIYILRLPDSEKYFVSDFSGTSLEFDAETKTIHEHNQCCAGRSHMNATYKVVNNKMVLIKQSCLEYDEVKEDFVEKKCD